MSTRVCGSGLLAATTATSTGLGAEVWVGSAMILDIVRVIRHSGSNAARAVACITVLKIPPDLASSQVVSGLFRLLLPSALNERIKLAVSQVHTASQGLQSYGVLVLANLVRLTVVSLSRRSLLSC